MWRMDPVLIKIRASNLNIASYGELCAFFLEVDHTGSITIWAGVQNAWYLLTEHNYILNASIYFNCWNYYWLDISKISSINLDKHCVWGSLQKWTSPLGWFNWTDDLFLQGVWWSIIKVSANWTAIAFLNFSLDSLHDTRQALEISVSQITDLQACINNGLSGSTLSNLISEFCNSMHVLISWILKLHF